MFVHVACCYHRSCRVILTFAFSCWIRTGPHTDVCLKFDISASSGSQWSFLPSLPEGRAGGGMVYDSPSHALIFSGGAERPEPGNPDSIDYRHTWMLSLDDTASGWVAKTDLPFDSNHVSFATVNDVSSGLEHHLFLGGQVGENEHTGNIDENFEYVAATDTWVVKTSMPFTRGHASSSTRPIGCGLIIAGGSSNEVTGSKTPDISFYDYSTDIWTKVGDLPWNLGINTPVSFKLWTFLMRQNAPDVVLTCRPSFLSRSVWYTVPRKTNGSTAKVVSPTVCIRTAAASLSFRTSKLFYMMYTKIIIYLYVCGTVLPLGA